MSYDFGNPVPPRSFKAVDYPGDVVIVIKGGVHDAIKTAEYGTKPATRVTVIMLTGKEAGEVFEDALLWNKQHETFREEPPGKAVLCRIVAQGRGAMFDVASPYDRKVAGAWVDENRPLFDKLLAETVGNFHDREREIAEAEQRSASSAPTARQFEPPSNATRESLTDPQGSATEDEAGF